MSEAKLPPAGPKAWKPGDDTNNPGAEDMARAEFWADGIYQFPDYKAIVADEARFEEAFQSFAAERAWRRENSRRVDLGLSEIPFKLEQWLGRY